MALVKSSLRRLVKRRRRGKPRNYVIVCFQPSGCLAGRLRRLTCLWASLSLFTLSTVWNVAAYILVTRKPVQQSRKPLALIGIDRHLLH